MKKLISVIFCILILSSIGYAQWEQTSVGIWGGSISALAVDPTTNYIYSGTSNGIYKSTNNGSSWTAINDGLLYPDVRAIAISESNIFAGTYGGGVFLSNDNGSSWLPVNEGLTDNRVVQ
jgi:photosystem II stability/assembly factor-like uncharacterized protein